MKSELLRVIKGSKTYSASIIGFIRINHMVLYTSEPVKEAEAERRRRSQLIHDC